jgi:CHAD domain-containing protein
LKRFYYICKSLDLKDAKKARTGKALQERMGKWHDYRVANRHLMQTANHHNVPSTEIPALRKIAHELLSESKTLYRKINAEKNKHIV